MTDLVQLETWRDALLRARYAGLRRVEVVRVRLGPP